MRRILTKKGKLAVRWGLTNSLSFHTLDVSRGAVSLLSQCGLFPGGSQMTIPRHFLMSSRSVLFILPPSPMPDLGDPCGIRPRGGPRARHSSPQLS